MTFNQRQRKILITHSIILVPLVAALIMGLSTHDDVSYFMGALWGGVLVWIGFALRRKLAESDTP